MISIETTNPGRERTKLSQVAWQVAAISVLLCLSLLSSARLAAQTPSGPAGQQSMGPSGSDEQSSPSAAGASLSSGASTQSLYSGSVPEGEATSTVLPISFKDAINRALRNNLGLLISNDNLLAARGQKWQELSHLLPNVSAVATQAAEQIDLAALGFRFNFPGVSPVIGPIGTFDARAYVSGPIFDWHQIQRERGAAARESVAQYN
jgi:hypothetical protein